MTAEAPIPLAGNITSLPSDDPIRKRVDSTLKLIAFVDRQHSNGGDGGFPDYTINRGGEAYFQFFRGLAEMFFHVRGLQSNIILDIGAGTTKGIYQLSRTTFAEGLSFKATVLAPVEQIKDYLGLNNVYVTSAEYLDGIDDDSVGGVLALASIAYSQAPEFAIRRIDQVLVKGGIVKATFTSVSDASIMKTHIAFTAELRRLGYDIEIIKTAEDAWDLVVAVKPGGVKPISAAELLRRDLASIYQYQFTS